MNITGACHCGAITFEADADPDRVGICHCTDCQTLSASAFRTVVLVDADAFRLTGATPAEYVKRGHSGNRRIQAFCPTCGTAIYATNADGPPVVFNIRAGTVHQRDELVPKIEVWTRSALPWLPDIPGTRKFERSPE